MGPSRERLERSERERDRETATPTHDSRRPRSIGPIRHAEYYFDDGNLVLLVENTLYNVHRGMLKRHSELFFSMLSLPQPSGSSEGLKDSHPVKLQEVSSVDFERLLWILYPPVMGELKPTSLSEWLSILDLACRWAFDGVRNLAIREIEKLEIDPVDQIVIARRYDVKPEWLLPAYTALCERREPPTFIEAQKIRDLDIIMRLVQARETIQRAMWNGELSVLPPMRAGRASAAIWMPPLSAPNGHNILSPEDQLEIANLEPHERLPRAHLLTVAKFFNIQVPRIVEFVTEQ